VVVLHSFRRPNKSLQPTPPPTGGAAELVRWAGVFMNRAFRIAAIFLFQWNALSAATSDPKVAAQANTDGYRHHQKREYQQAIELFQKAVSLDPLNAKYHYNLACAVSLESGHRLFPRRVALAALEQAVKLDSARRDKMQKDPDLIHIRDTFKYQRLLDPSIKNVKTFVTNISWYAKPGLSEWGLPTMGLDLQPDGAAILLWLQAPTEIHAVPKDGIKHISSEDHSRLIGKGRYQIEGNKVHIQFDPKASFQIWGEPVEIVDWHGTLDFGKESLIFLDPKLLFNDNSNDNGAGAE
jgi:tetratricopeptide (TPR) repeat protein